MMPVERVRLVWLPRLAWGGALAMACLMAVCWLGPGAGHSNKTVCYALMRNLKTLQADLAQFPERVRTVMQIEHGLHALIEEQP